MKAGQTADRQLWASVDAESRRTTREACGPYPCLELEAYLAEHPEKESPLLRAYMARQQGREREA